jgi:Tat-targeted selenate reductase subunit YnfH
MENFVSLLLFTYAAQTAIGMILVREIMVFTGITKREEELYLRSQYLITILLIISLAVAFLHLHKPLHAIFALNNLSNSPLSKEIASLSFLTGVSLLTIWVIRRSAQARSAEILLSIASVVGALLLLFTMTSIYILPSVPSWYKPLTPLSFFLTVVSAGPAVMSLLTLRGDRIKTFRLLTIAVTGILLLAVAGSKAIVNGNILDVTLISIQITTALISAVTLFLLTRGSHMNKIHSLTVITTMLILISGIAARLLFFLSYDNNIL